MKKILLFIIMILTLGVTGVYALESNVTSISVKEKSSTIIVDEPTVTNNSINAKVTFKNVGDYVIFTLGLDIDTSLYTIESVTDNNQSEHIKTTYTVVDNKVEMKLEYESELTTSMDLDDIIITINIKDKDGNSDIVVINPGTDDNIIKYITILGISTLTLTGLILLRKKKTIIGVILLIAIIPTMVIAEEKMNLSVSLEKDDIKVGYDVVFNGGDGATGSTDTKLCYFGEPCTLPENNFEKEGKGFAGWATSINGEIVFLDEEEVENLIAGGEYNLYAVWSDIITYPYGKTKETVVTGDIVTINDTEEFYVLKHDGDNLVLLAHYNLKVGNIYNMSGTKSGEYTSSDPGYGRQSSDCKGYVLGVMKPRNGTVAFSSEDYWDEKVGTDYPGSYCVISSGTNCAYVYDSNSNIYQYVNNYKTYLENIGVNVLEARLMSLEESSAFSNVNNMAWRETSYWLGSAYPGSLIWSVGSDNSIGYMNYNVESSSGVRPVIII